MSTFPTGVSIITTGRPGGAAAGMTCSSVCSVSLDPPTLLICLRKGSQTLDAVLRESTFAVNLLHDGARSAAEVFASNITGRFDQVEWCNDPSFGGPHLMQDTHSIADCRISRTLSVGDHQVIFGEIFRVTQESPEQARPLMYGLRRFSSWPAEAEGR
ncbi:flavin reductase family protein [Nocardia sp. NPDC049149]|uniref:flavin reductase family protein n=1 Tax=Nocardia sp. NPDC049149 TaxID=3364315 RepID=UPI003722D890